MVFQVKLWWVAFIWHDDLWLRKIVLQKDIYKLKDDFTKGSFTKGVGLRDPTGSLKDAQRRRARENKDPDPAVGGSLSRSRRLSGVQGSGWMGVSDPIGALGRAGGRWLGTSGSGVFRSRWRTGCPASWIFPGNGHFRGCGFFFLIWRAFLSYAWCHIN